jgi:Zn-finger nucleic acid-binding protein
MRTCPDCQHELIEVSFDSEKAGKIHCWYCSNCGGAFFEHWDSNLLSLTDIKQELARLFKQDEEVITINQTPSCPMDTTVMNPIVSAAVPAGIKIFFCPTCRGNWFPKGELVKFKMEQEGKLAQLKKMNMPMASIFSLFLPVLFVAVMTGVTFYARSVILNQQSLNMQAKAASYQKMLQIKKISATSVEISFFTDEPSKSIIYYKAEGVVLNKNENDFSRYHYVVIDNLNNPVNYLFQIQTTTSSEKIYNSEWLSAK